MTGGILLAVAPGIGYLIVWIHDFGYANHFHIPAALIAPQIGEVITTAIGLAIVIGLAFGLVDSYLYIRQNRVGPVEARLWMLAGVALLFALVLYSAWGAPWDWMATALWAAIVLFLSVPIVGPAVLRDRRGNSEPQGSRHLPLLTAVTRQVGPVPLILGVAVLVIMQGAYDLGISDAQGQAVFLVSEVSPPEVVLAIWGDTVVLAPFDNSTHLVSRDFDIVKIGSQPLHLTRMPIGPLKTQCSDPSVPEGSYYAC